MGDWIIAGLACVVAVLSVVNACLAERNRRQAERLLERMKERL